MSETPIDLGRPQSGDVIDLIVADHYRFEHLLRQLRDSSADRDAARRAFAALHTAHAGAEETEVYPRLLGEVVDVHVGEHGEEEHAEGHEALLAVLDAPDTTGADFDEAVEELSRLVSHHLVEEELSILNPARRSADPALRAELGERFSSARNAALDAGCGGVAQLRDLVEQAREQGLLGRSAPTTS